MMNFINNLPKYAETCKYIVARRCEGEWWFWGGFDADERNRANEAAMEIGGTVFTNEEI